MPNRIIKESISTSDTLAEISADAERLWWRLVVQADDYGCFDGRPNVILGKCLTAFIGRFTAADVDRWLDEMEDVGLIRRYVVDGRPYIHLEKWSEHQTPPRSNKPKYPLPPNPSVPAKLLPDESDVEQLIFTLLQRQGEILGSEITLLERQVRVRESYLDIVARTQAETYVFEIKRNRLSNKAVEQILRYLELVPGKGILIGNGLASNFDVAACEEAGIAVIVYDDNFNWTVIHDGGFAKPSPLPDVTSREITSPHVRRLIENENVNENVIVNGEDDELWSSFRQHFTQAFGGLPNKTHFDEVDGFVTDGMELAAVVEAVRLAAINKARGWGYVRRIVQNWLKDGVRTLEQVKSRDAPAETPRLAVVGHYAPGQDPNKELVE